MGRRPLRRPQGPLARTPGSSAKDRLAADRRLAGRDQNIAAGRQIDIDPAAETDQPDTLACRYASPLAHESHDPPRDQPGDQHHADLLALPGFR